MSNEQVATSYESLVFTEAEILHGRATMAQIIRHARQSEFHPLKHAKIPEVIEFPDIDVDGILGYE